MLKRSKFSVSLLVLSLSLGAAGCERPSEDPETLAARSKYLVSAELPGAMSLTKAAALVGVGSDLKADDDVKTSEEGSTSDDAKREAEASTTKTPAADAEPKPSVDLANEVKEVPDVTVVGRVHAGQLEPWEDGKASFMLSELPEDGHGEGHDSDNCPFCKRRLAKAPTAIVKFVDAQGQTLPIDSRKLFGLEKDQTVEVRGTVIAGEFNSIVLVADQLHIRK